MDVPSTGCSDRFWASPPLLFLSNCELQGGFALGLQCCSLAIPIGTQETWGDPWEDWMRIERKGGRKREKKAPFFLSETVVPFQSEKKKKKRRRGGEEGQRGRNFLATSLLSTHCKLPAAVSPAPALLAPLASAPKFLTTFFPAGNVNQDTFRNKKKKNKKQSEQKPKQTWIRMPHSPLWIM